MTHKIYIAGITATGKTTTAGRLSEFLNIPFVSLDEAYKKIGDEIKCKPEDARHLIWPQTLQLHRQWKERLKEAYAEVLAPIKDKDAIIEGFSLGNVYKRSIIDEILGTHKKTFFVLQPPIDQWMRNYRANGVKATDDELRAVFDKWEAFETPPDKYWKVPDTNRLFVNYEPYQRQGLTDIKWEQLQVKGLRGQTVLDIGCNSGWIGKFCMENGAAEVTGVDYNWRYLQDAADAGYTHTILADLNDTGRLRSELRKYDRIFCLATLHHIKNKPVLIEFMAGRTIKECIIEMPISGKPGIDEESYNGLKIPTMGLMKIWLNAAFKSSEAIGKSISPDGDKSTRYIFKCQK